MPERAPLPRRRGAAAPLLSQPSLLGLDAPPLVESAILHVRIADFAVAVAARLRPELDGCALIVGNTAGGRGIVLAASPAARADGVVPGMTLREAEKLCPHAVALPTDPEALAGAAREALAILGCYTPVVEPDWQRAEGKKRRKAGPADWERLASSFGATLDVRGSERLFGPPHRMAARIAAHLAEHGYAARVGVAANPSLAAVASAVAGIDEAHPSPCPVPAGQERAFLDDLPLTLFAALDDDLLEHLRVLGIRKAGQLARLPTAGVRRRFGPAGESAQAQARGEAQRPLLVPPAPPTLDAACTLEVPAVEMPGLEHALARLAARLARQLAARGQSASLLTLQVTMAPHMGGLPCRGTPCGCPGCADGGHPQGVPLQPATDVCRPGTVQGQAPSLDRYAPATDRSRLCHATAVDRSGQDWETPSFRAGSGSCRAKPRVSTRTPRHEGGLNPAAGPDMRPASGYHSPASMPGFPSRRSRPLPTPCTLPWTAVAGSEIRERSLHLKQPVAGEAAILARARELLLQLAPDGPVAALAITLSDLGAAATQLSFPLLIAGNGTRAREDMEAVTQRLRRRFGPRAARRVRLVEALLPEERVAWDGPEGASGRRILPLAVRADAAGRPLALRRGAGHWEQVRTICAHWRLRTRWWAEVTHRHYYLVEMSAGAVLEIYHEQRDGRWHLSGKRD